MNLSQRQLRLFTTTAATRNISRAAEALHMSQPTLTRAVKELESQLGVNLFHRTTRRLALTWEGERFLPVAQRLLRDMDQALGELRQQADGRSGLVSLSVGTAFASVVLPEVIKQLATDHPRLRLKVIDATSAAITASVSRAEVDLGIATPVGSIAGIDCTPLLRMPLGLLANPEHHRLRPGMSAAQIASLPILRDGADTSIAQMLRVHGSPVLATFESGHEVSSLALQLAIVRAGAGVAVVSALGASHPLAQGMRFQPIRPRVEREIFLMRRRDHAESPSVRAVASVVTRCCATLKWAVRAGA